VLIVKVAEDELATVTEPGTESAETLLVKDTEAPDAGTALDNVTVQEVLELAVRLLAAHCREETTGADTSATEAFAEDPLRVAVIVAF
jgi:hypothetical protein